MSADLLQQYWARGTEILGKRNNWLVAKLLKAKGNVALARSVLELASTKDEPVKYLMRVCHPVSEGKVTGSAAVDWEIRKRWAAIERAKDRPAPTMEQKAHVAEVHGTFRGWARRLKAPIGDPTRIMADLAERKRRNEERA